MLASLFSSLETEPLNTFLGDRLFLTGDGPTSDDAQLLDKFNRKEAGVWSFPNAQRWRDRIQSYSEEERSAFPPGCWIDEGARKALYAKTLTSLAHFGIECDAPTHCVLCWVPFLGDVKPQMSHLFPKCILELGADYNAARELPSDCVGVFHGVRSDRISPKNATVPLLCFNCEQRFGVWEGAFLRQVYDPVYSAVFKKIGKSKPQSKKSKKRNGAKEDSEEKPATTLEEDITALKKISLNDRQLTLFAVSVLWRTVILNTEAFEAIERYRGILLGEEVEALPFVSIQCDFDLLANPTASLDELDLAANIIANTLTGNEYLAFLGFVSVSILQQDVLQRKMTMLPFPPLYRTWKLHYLQHAGHVPAFVDQGTPQPGVEPGEHKPLFSNGKSDPGVYFLRLLPDGVRFQDGVFEFPPSEKYSPKERSHSKMQVDGIGATLDVFIEFATAMKTNKVTRQSEKVMCWFVCMPSDLRMRFYCASFEEKDGDVVWDRDLNKVAFSKHSPKVVADMLTLGRRSIASYKEYREKQYRDHKAATTGKAG